MRLLGIRLLCFLMFACIGVMLQTLVYGGSFLYYVPECMHVL